ncbi:MAG TPA: DUF3307 domain-containing protein [Balneolaceae bacterium]|nr:DUF3307 domain-containing protein [Balneolaceae bacterium]|tara:strand:+ start:269647 stop:270387 length:741 start_codon:yes stop_codon:yes gene_type:complete
MTPFEELLIMLVFAHLVGDFIFQRTEWVIQRQEKRWASPELYLHGLFHAVLYELVFWYHSVLEFWYLGIILGLVHILIDPLKKQSYKAQTLWFIGDQLVHLALITAASWYIFSASADMFWHSIHLDWKIATAYLFLTKPASIFISYLLPARPSTLEKETNIKGLGSEKAQKGITNAGEFIGILERLLTLTFILQSAWIGIGFLITAKSVFRFSDIQQSKQREETEYIMIGTLLSFSIAILCGILLI